MTDNFIALTAIIPVRGRSRNEFLRKTIPALRNDAWELRNGVSVIRKK